MTELPVSSSQPSRAASANSGPLLPPLALREPQRLHALQATGLLDSPPEPAFDRLTALACRWLQAPVALVSLIDAEREFIKSGHGLPDAVATQRNLPLSHSFCQHVVASQQPLIANDVRENPLICDNLAIRDFGVVAYLGIPLSTPDGQVIGSLCTIDVKPRRWSDDDVETLSELAALTMTEIALRYALREQERANNSLQQSLQEITERSQAEANFRSLFESMTQGVVYQDAHGKITMANAAAESFLGLTLAEMQGRVSADPRWRAIRTDGTEFAGEEHPAIVALRTGQVQRGVIMGVVNPRLNALRWLRVDAVPQFNPGETQPYQVYSLFSDITERRQVREALLRSEQHLRNVIDNLGAFVGVMTPDGILIEANRTALRAANLQPADVLGKLCEETYWWSYSPEVKAQLRMAIKRAAAGEALRYDVKVRMAEDRYLTIDFMLAPIFDEQGNVTYLVPSAIDVTERRQAEQQLAYHAHLLDNMHDAVIATDAQFRITAWNRGAEQLYGWQASEVLGRPLREVIQSKLSDEQRNMTIQALDATGRYRLDVVTYHKSGAPIYIEGITVALRDPEGQITGYLGINRDMTERVRYEDALKSLNATLEQRVAERTAQLTQRNQELDRFAYVASHDLKSPLRAIDHLAAWIAEDADAALPPASQEHLKKMRGRVKRMERLLDDLLAYSRADRYQYPAEIVDIAVLVGEIIKLITVPEQFVVTVSESFPVFVTVRAPLELVLRNLIDNAIKHHDRADGRIQIAANHLGELLEFTVSDDGPGIALMYHERIFELFQTLKPRDVTEGSGMGLAIVKKIVESYGGTLSVASTEGCGATFRFTWPKHAN